MLRPEASSLRSFAAFREFRLAARTARKGKLPMGERPQYNVWIRLDRLWFSSSLALLSLVAVALSVFSPWFLLFVIPFCVFLYISVIVGMAKRFLASFSRR